MSKFVTLVVLDTHHNAVNNIFIQQTENEMTLKVFGYALNIMNEQQNIGSDHCNNWYNLSHTLLSEECASEMALSVENLFFQLI
jgi:hypothetical protein